jgi:hypothetical protein
MVTTAARPLARYLRLTAVDIAAPRLVGARVAASASPTSGSSPRRTLFPARKAA